MPSIPCFSPFFRFFFFLPSLPTNARNTTLCLPSFLPPPLSSPASTHHSATLPRLSSSAGRPALPSPGTGTMHTCQYSPGTPDQGGNAGHSKRTSRGEGEACTSIRVNVVTRRSFLFSFLSSFVLPLLLTVLAASSLSFTSWFLPSFLLPFLFPTSFLPSSQLFPPPFL